MEVNSFIGQFINSGSAKASIIPYQVWLQFPPSCNKKIPLLQVGIEQGQIQGGVKEGPSKSLSIPRAVTVISKLCKDFYELYA